MVEVDLKAVAQIVEMATQKALVGDTKATYQTLCRISTQALQRMVQLGIVTDQKKEQKLSEATPDEAIDVVMSLSVESVDQQIAECNQRLAKLKQLRSIVGRAKPRETNVSQVINWLRENRPAKPKAIAEGTGLTTSQVSSVINQNREQFTKTDNGWVLAEDSE